ncbi:MAG: Ig-like domain-containing protein [Candidatus Eisenbacteria bacterium]|nr:Ig-like domain-containing protein [Candidatus Eisenbacteria bacterium]
MLVPGRQTTFHAVARDARGTQVSVALHWTLADTAVAVVDSQGVVSAKAVGRTVVEVRTRALKAAATVRVDAGEPPAAQVTVTPASATFLAGDRQPFVADPRDASGRFVPAPVHWSVEPATVASVGPDGQVLCLAAGSATVTAEVDGVRGTARLTVLAAPTVSTEAGAGSAGEQDGDPAVATFRNPMGLAVDSLGSVYVVDNGNHRIRVIERGQVRTLAGSGPGFADGRGAAAQFRFPAGIAVGPGRLLYVADQGNHCIRRVDTGGNVTTVAGQPGFPAYVDSTADEAYFRTPTSVAVDATGRIFVADRGNSVIRVIEPGGRVKTLCGTPLVSGYVDGKPGRMDEPAGLTIGPGGVLYVCERGSGAITSGSVVRQVSPDGVLSTVAGNGIPGSLFGPRPYGQFDQPFAVAVGPDGYVYVADTGNRQVRSASPTGYISNVAGTGVSGFLDGPGEASMWKYPAGIVALSSGDLLVSDMIAQRVRRVRGTLHAAPVTWPESAVRLLPRPGFGPSARRVVRAPLPDYSLPAGASRPVAARGPFTRARPVR